MITMLFRDCGVYSPKETDTQVLFWADNAESLNSDDRLLIPIDLSKGLAAILTNRQKNLDEVQHDPDRMQRNSFGEIEGLRISDKHWWRACLDGRVRRPLDQFGRDYEFSESVDVDGPSGTIGNRYRGFHAQVHSVDPKENTALIQIFDGGLSLADDPVTILRSVSLEEFDGGGILDMTHTTIDPTDPMKHEGAIYIENFTWRKWRLTIPKLPPGLARES